MIDFTSSEKVVYDFSENKEFTSLTQLLYAINNMSKSEVIAKLQKNIDKGYKLIKADNE